MQSELSLTRATRVIDLARSGLIDSAALRDRVIAEARLADAIAEHE